MTELEPSRLNVIGSVKGRRAIKDAKLGLAKSYGVPLERIGHCVDGIEHAELGENAGFVAGREKGKQQVYLLLVRPDGGQEVVPHYYLSSAIHTGLSAANAKRMVHFYIIGRRHTPLPKAEEHEED